jgi:hypothetical protein
MHVSQIYDGDGGPPDMKSELKKAAADRRRLPAGVLWRLGERGHNGVGSHGCCRPCAHQLNQDLLLFLGFSLSDPELGLFGILPELIDFRHRHHPLRQRPPMKPAPMAAGLSEQNCSRVSAMHSIDIGAGEDSTIVAAVIGMARGIRCGWLLGRGHAGANGIYAGSPK